MKTLAVMRHAKSDWDAGNDSDHERPLSDRGYRSARLMGRLIAGLGMAPDHVISSTAVRARMTASLASEAGRWDVRIALERRLYGASPGTVVKIVSGAPDVDRLMIVGHQPTSGMLVNRLTGAVADMKTASIAVVEFMIDDWKEVESVQGVLTFLYHPRPFFGSQWDVD